MSIGLNEIHEAYREGYRTVGADEPILDDDVVLRFTQSHTLLGANWARDERCLLLAWFLERSEPDVVWCVRRVVGAPVGFRRVTRYDIAKKVAGTYIERR